MQKNKPMLISIQKLQVENERQPIILPLNCSSTNDTEVLDGFVFLGKGLRPVTMQMKCEEARFFTGLCTSRLCLVPWYF